jgi:hypothetical protein
MLDCHIIVSADTPRDWVAQCLDSVHAAAECAGYPVHVHTVSAVPGHIGRARAAGYAIGDQPYVTSVDDDDYVLLDAFAVLRPALDAGPDAIYTRETTLQNGYPRVTDRRHHLAVYRRELLHGFDFGRWPAYDAMALRTHVERQARAVVDLPDAVYVYRLRGDSPARVIQRQHPELLETARGR